MNRQQKEELIGSLRTAFSDNQASFLVRYRGLRVDQMQDLRGKLRDKGGRFQIAKARLMKRAVDGLSGIDELAPYLKDQIGIAFAPDDAAAVAKLLCDFAKTNEHLQVVVGCLDAAVIDAASVTRIASLPSREVLLAQALSGFNAPLNNFGCVLRMMLMRLLFVFKKVAEKKG